LESINLNLLIQYKWAIDPNLNRNYFKIGVFSGTEATLISFRSYLCKIIGWLLINSCCWPHL